MNSPIQVDAFTYSSLPGGALTRISKSPYVTLKSRRRTRFPCQSRGGHDEKDPFLAVDFYPFK
jgi:hypothetical protein